MTKPIPQSDVKASDYNDLHKATGITQVERNLDSIRTIKSNPNVYNPRCWGRAQHAAVPVAYKTPKYREGLIPPKTVEAGVTDILASQTEDLAKDLNQLANVHNSAIGDLVGNLTPEPPVAAQGETLEAAVLQAAYEILDEIRRNAAKYDGWYDSNNLCNRSCQLNCQVGCQVACQGCNNGTCHNQKCGGH